MSKERELLKQVIKNQYINDSDNKKLQADIEELLAQPEQEPLSEDEIDIGVDDGN